MVADDAQRSHGCHGVASRSDAVQWAPVLSRFNRDAAEEPQKAAKASLEVPHVWILTTAI